MDFTYPTPSFFAQTNELTSYKNVLTQLDFSNWNPLWILSIIHFSIIKNGFWFLTFWIGPLLGVSGYITINVKLMGHYIDIKLRLWLKVSLNLKGLIIIKHFPLPSKWFHYEFYLFWPLFMTIMSINLMSNLHFYMVI
jgi:hypothetical protein